MHKKQASNTLQYNYLFNGYYNSFKKKMLFYSVNETDMVFNRMVCINSHKEGCDQLFMEINRFKDDKLALVYNINSIILLITPQIITNWNIFFNNS